MHRGGHLSICSHRIGIELCRHANQAAEPVQGVQAQQAIAFSDTGDQPKEGIRDLPFILYMLHMNISEKRNVKEKRWKE